MSPPAAVAAVAAVIAAGTYLVAVLDHLFSGRVGGERLRAGALLAPARRGALLLLQRRTTTERPDAEAWALAPPLLAGLGAVALTAIPLAPGMAIADVPAGIVLFGAALVQVMVAVFLHGWGSNSAFPLIGAFRMAAVALSLGIPLSLVLIGAALPAESLSVGRIVASQADLWNVVRQPLGLPIYLVAGLGFAFWGPLNLPDAADIAGGTAAEAAGPGLLVWRAARATVLLAVAAMGAAAFLGGHLGPLLPGWLWTVVKTLALAALLVGAGHLLGRPRIEVVVRAGWLVLLPLALVDVFVSGALIL